MKFKLTIAICFVLVFFQFSNGQEQSKTRILLIQTYDVPRAERDSFFIFMDTYLVPEINANPHILSRRVAIHNYGPAEPNMWVFTEFASLTAIDLADAWSDTYYEELYPKNSAKRKEYDAARERYFVKYWQHHTDTILLADEKRVK